MNIQKGEKETFQTLDVIPRLHFYDFQTEPNS